MPKVKRIKRGDILSAGIDVIREKGVDGLNARTLSVRLGCSTQPLYSEFGNMDGLKGALLEAVYLRYEDFVAHEASSGKYPAYKAYGVAYFVFAKEEPELFRFLFLRSREEGEKSWEAERLRPVVEGIASAAGLSYEDALTLHVEMWSLVHGFATQTVTGYLVWQTEQVSELLTVAYRGIKERLCVEEGKG